MSDWIGLGIIILVVVGGFYALMRANEPKPLTEEEFQRRANESRGLAGAGFSALQQALDPATERAEAVIQDMRQGYYEGEQESGDDNDTSPEESEQGENKNEKAGDA
jgi:hypothetical protein